MNEQQLARGLGWFSIGLGLTEILAPREVGKSIGVFQRDSLIRSLGCREVASGIGLLSGRRPNSAWAWSRVAGDVMDLALLGTALKRSAQQDRGKVTGAIALVVGVAVLDVWCGAKLTQDERRRFEEQLPRDSTGQTLGLARGKLTRKSIIINRPAEEIYAFWRNFENLPRFMTHLKSVTVSGDGRSHWVAQGPIGKDVSWEAETIADEPNELIAWRTLPGSTVESAGTVRFEPAVGDRGTVVRVDMQYRPPLGALGATVAKWLGQAPEKQVPLDLMRFKQLLETGEIATTEGQPSGRKRSTSLVDDLVRA